MADRYSDRLRNEDAERRGRLDDQERRERDRRREYGRGYEPEWGDYPYRGETWHVPETSRGWDAERRWQSPARRDYGPYPGEAGTRKYGYGNETYNRPYDRPNRPGWESGAPDDYTGRGPKGYQRSDARIHEDVCDRLAEAPDVDASDIEVRTTNGEVTVSGTVREREDKRRVEDLIEGIPGVRDIHNHLRVGKPQAETTRTTSGT